MGILRKKDKLKEKIKKANKERSKLERENKARFAKKKARAEECEKKRLLNLAKEKEELGEYRPGKMVKRNFTSKNIEDVEVENEKWI